MKTTKNLNVWLAMAMFLLLMVSTTAAGRNIYVDADARGDPTGSRCRRPDCRRAGDYLPAQR